MPRRRRLDRKLHARYLWLGVIDASQESVWRRRLFDAPLHAAFPIDARHSEELPDDVVRGLRRYGLRYRVARVPRTAETTFAGPGWDGFEVFRFTASRYPDIVGYSANHSAVR